MEGVYIFFPLENKLIKNKYFESINIPTIWSKDVPKKIDLFMECEAW